MKWKNTHNSIEIGGKYLSVETLPNKTHRKDHNICTPTYTTIFIREPGYIFKWLNNKCSIVYYVVLKERD